MMWREIRKLSLEKHTLAYTYCQVPVKYLLSKEKEKL